MQHALKALHLTNRMFYKFNDENQLEVHLPDIMYPITNAHVNFTVFESALNMNKYIMTTSTSMQHAKNMRQRGDKKYIFKYF